MAELISEHDATVFMFRATCSVLELPAKRPRYVQRWGDDDDLKNQKRFQAIVQVFTKRHDDAGGLMKLELGNYVDERAANQALNDFVRECRA